MRSIALGVATLLLVSTLASGAIKLDPETIDIPGIVTDTHGDPVANADVMFSESDSSAEGRLTDGVEMARTKTDSAGRFVIKGMSLTKFRINYWVSATADGYALGGVGLDPAGGKKFYNF